MRFNQKLMIIAFLCVLGTCIYVVYHTRNKSTPQIPPLSQKVKDSAQNLKNSLTNLGATNESSKDTDWTKQVPPQDREWMIQRATKVERLMSGANVPIEFYGKIVDQYDQPIEGVEVLAIISQWHALPGAMFGATWLTNRMHTDASGHFIVHNIRGDTYDIRSITKSGYELEPGSPMGFGYGNATPMHHVPDSNNPVLFRMWRSNGGANLLGFNAKGMIPCNGESVWLTPQSYRFAKTDSQDAVIRITASRSIGIVSFTNHGDYSWSIEIEPIGGGIQQSESVFMYEAPESGYQPQLSVTHNANDPGWLREQNIKFFFKTKRGEYGCGEFFISNWENEKGIYCRIGAGLNPDGSRNLEPKREEPAAQ